MSRLLINEPALQVLPTLARAIGLNEAIFLQQLHYWISHKNAPEREGHRWHYESYPKWLDQFPFWSLNTLIRIVKKLRKMNLLMARPLNSRSGNQTLWYSINYLELDKLDNLLVTAEQPVDKEGHLPKMGRCTSTQNEQAINPKWVDVYKEKENNKTNYLKENTVIEQPPTIKDFIKNVNFVEEEQIDRPLLNEIEDRLNAVERKS